MFKIAEYGYVKTQVKNYNEYISDTFEELPTDATFGDRAIFNDNGVMKIAIFFSNGWVRSE